MVSVSAMMESIPTVFADERLMARRALRDNCPRRPSVRAPFGVGLVGDATLVEIVDGQRLSRSVG